MVKKKLGKMNEGLKTAVKKIEIALQDDTVVRLYHKLKYEKMVKENVKIRTEEKNKRSRRKRNS